MSLPTGILLLSIFAASFWLLLRVRRKITDIAEAMETRQSELDDVGGSWLTGLVGLPRLRSATNQLLQEHASRSAAERSHLDQIQATLGRIREAVLLISDENQVLMASDAFRQYYPAALNPLGKRLESLVRGLEFTEYVLQLRQSGSGERRSCEVRIEGRPYWFEITGTRLPGFGAEAASSLLVMHDITRQKHLEAMRTEFVANVSHELRTPVTIIKGFADTLVEDHAELAPEDQHRFLIKIQKNSDRLHRLLEELLQLSRLEGGQEMLELEAHRLSRVASEAAENFRHRMGPNLRLEIDIEPEGDRARMDPLRLTQVLDNLLDNVLRHARGATLVRVLVRREGSKILCAVEDNGPGIPEADLPRIFERFYRVDKGRSRELGGTGLGLSIVKHIIQAHGGEVFARSRLGQGSRIGFALPAVD